MPEHTIGCLTVVETGPVTTHLGLMQVDFPPNVEVSGSDSASIYEKFRAIRNYAPVATFTSKAINKLISMVGLNGICVGAGRPITQVDVISRKLETCQTALGGTPHLRHRVTTGLIRLGSLTADRGQDAQITGMLDTLTDGTNGPVAITDGVAMPSPIVEDIVFTLGEFIVGGVAHPDVEGISIDFNVQTTDKTPKLAAVWPHSIGVLKVLPTMTLRGRDLSKITAAMLAFTANDAAHANTIIQLVRRKNRSAFEPDAITVHVSITGAGLIVPENLVSGSANQRATNSIRVEFLDDGTNAPLLFNVAAAYDPTP